jgi:hypothetical protein
MFLLRRLATHARRMFKPAIRASWPLHGNMTVQNSAQTYPAAIQKTASATTATTDVQSKHPEYGARQCIEAVYHA